MSSIAPNGGRDPIPPRSDGADAIPDSQELLIIQAQSLLEDIEETLKREMKRCKQSYGKHFPELNNIIDDNLLFFQVVKRIGKRENLNNIDLSDLLTAVQRFDIFRAANGSKGIEISDDDIAFINSLCDHIITLFSHRAYLHNLLQKRMTSVAPNLTALLGAKLGAKIIVHADTLMSLARQPPPGRTNGPSKSNGTQARKKTNTSQYGGECSKTFTETSNRGSNSAEQYGEGSSTQKKGAKPNQARDDIDMDEDAVKMDQLTEGAGQFSLRQVSEDEADDEDSDSEVEEKTAKGGKKVYHI